VTYEYVGQFLLVVLLMAVVDVCYARYTLEMVAKRAMPAALWSGSIMACGSFVTVNYVHDRTFIFAAILGAFIGTYYTILHSNRNDDEPAATEIGGHHGTAV
jgi:lipid-A-disaccharide synthase-like uncharacterized protein